MDYLSMVEKFLLESDEYLKRIIYAIAPIFKPEKGVYKDVTVNRVYSLFR